MSMRGMLCHLPLELYCYSSFLRKLYFTLFTLFLSSSAAVRVISCDSVIFILV